ncbi:hypothetical protein RB199_03360 [Streptomyces libani]|uniref:Immunity protein 35 domain-containing protein n=3 Tax=Streptomyces TaxID=1883 RepID=A0A640TMZ0_STRNI|nr:MULTISPECIES: hypothetical protein [Streptomyces]MCW7984631.1 hypothetical protein [Streptomyces platensis subsp. clarensis]MCR8575422.1 hypothetical protein [Streptomyces sp. Isolate_219]MCX5446843.1 hypothetical protein [Streptomyces libani]MYT12654.1 hypothetical protein [Streptomyces sp. SID4951]MYX05761.1 hypothetical protein [Streptomyces sp. SID8375]
MTDSDQSGSVPGLPPTPPPLPPQTGPQTVPANADEALEIGREHYPEVGSPGGPSGLFVHEFDIGYLIHASWPPAEDPTAPPANPGGSNVVISKADGEVSFLPNFPPEEAVELYHRLRGGRTS